MHLNKKIGAVVVAYNPDTRLFLRTIHSIAPQVNTVCVVDNSPSSGELEMSLSSFGNCRYISMGGNVGIAAAQNAGIRFLMEEGMDFVLFSDQDSEAPEGMVKSLVDAYMSLSASEKVFALGPTPVDATSGRSFMRYGGNVIGETILNGKSYKEVHYIFSSMTLAPVGSFVDAGMLNESLFIDGVDSEWCFRGRHVSGAKVFVLDYLSFSHHLGENRQVMGRARSVATPFRVYHQFRNYFWLRRLPYTPSFWIKRNLKGYIQKAVYYPLFCTPRLKYAAAILRGIRDGVMGKIGE